MEVEDDDTECGSAQCLLQVPTTTDTTGANNDWENFWIQCDACNKWFHGRCAGIEEYEEAYIDVHHCNDCKPTHGPNTLKEVRNDHRYAFDQSDPNKMKKMQIGTKLFVEEFMQNEEAIPSAISAGHVEHVDNGYSVGHEHLKRCGWKKPILIDSLAGLQAKIPGVEFTIDDVVNKIGADHMVDTIDVYCQRSYKMSLGNFQKKWNDVNRLRLYNILSLELSKTGLDELVDVPDVVKQLSWAHQFWSQRNEETISHVQQKAISAESTFHEHRAHQPRVAKFCLLGMGGSYTDFHIDFGGSSVWYHVHTGEKIFYVVEPTVENMDIYFNHQLDSHHSEVFFGDKVKDQLFRLPVKQGQTLMIPAGWIHAVYTPTDSLVFGGNFLNSLHIETQLKVFDMELKLKTDDRFKYPHFKLCNWYAAKHLAEILEGWLPGYSTVKNTFELKQIPIEDANESKEKASSYVVNGAQLLAAALRRWHGEQKSDPNAKKSVTSVNYLSIACLLEKRLKAQQKITSPKQCTPKKSATRHPKTKTVGARKKSGIKIQIPCNEIHIAPEEKTEGADKGLPSNKPTILSPNYAAKSLPASDYSLFDLSPSYVAPSTPKDVGTQSQTKAKQTMVKATTEVSDVQSMFKNVSSHGRQPRPAAWTGLKLDPLPSTSPSETIGKGVQKSPAIFSKDLGQHCYTHNDYFFPRYVETDDVLPAVKKQKSSKPVEKPKKESQSPVCGSGQTSKPKLKKGQATAKQRLASKLGLSAVRMRF